MSLLTAAAAPKVAVVGAGVVGLASALHIREELNAEVCIIAEEYGKDTTSYGSGGLWEPYTLAETPEELSNRWGAATFRHFEQLYRTNQGAQEAGVQLVTGFELYSDPKPQRPVWADTVYGFRAVGAEELQAMGFVSHKAGWTFTTFVADQSRYMPWLLHRVEAAGVRCEQRRIESLEPLPSECDVLVNCSGMGAKLLFGDDSMYPVRGQVVRVKAPWVKHVFLVDSESYLIPQVDSVVLGGTRQVGDYNVHADPVDTKSILEKCNRIVAGVADAPVVSEWAGLRPGRQSVRLELGQPLMSNGRSVPIVHNYGHGGAGVTLHWGCAQDVTQLVQAALTTA